MLRQHEPDSPVAWAEGRTTTALEMRGHVEALAALLPPSQEGEELLLVCRDRYRFAVALLAAWQRGFAVALPPNPQLETIRALRRRPGVVTVVHDVDRVDKGLDVRDAAIVEAVREGAGRASLRVLPEPAPERRLATVYTSGSTGAHTACPKTAAQLLGETRMLAQTFPLPGAARVVPMVPPHHIYGLLFGVLLPLVSGGAFYRYTPLHAPEVAAVLGSGADALVTVPAHLRGLLLAERGELPPVSRVFSSAAPLSPRVATAVQERFGWVITEVFGSSETGGIGWRQSGGAGPWTPFPGVSVTAGEGERLRLDSPFLPPDVERPYLGSDRVEIHEDGRFSHLGRTDGVLKIGGVRVSLAEIETRLLAIDGVRDVAVLAKEVGGARQVEVWAAVVAPELEAGAIRASLRGWLSPIAMPRRLKLVDRLPRTESGKLPRQAFEALFGPSRPRKEDG